MDKAEKLYQNLKLLQQKKGYLFNDDYKTTMELISSLLVNKERYGYMSCPCRLASDDYENDKDIICPCDYRQADIKEFGSCYCNLYVSSAWNSGVVPRVIVPERRPVDKLF